jgi:hypothetical protein
MIELRTWMKIGLCVLLIGLCLYIMKGRIFVSKQISFDPVVIEKTFDIDRNDFIPSDTFTTYKMGYVFKLDDKGLGYYKDIVGL